MADTTRDSVFNSMYGGYVPSSLPPPVVLTHNFWDNEKIASTVTPRYIQLHLPEQLHARLTSPLSGDLTDLTYSEWIISRTRKLFLILDELSLASRIFDLIDQSWCDDDLPLTQETIEKLDLGSYQLERRFHKKQHLFLLRDMCEGKHIDYKDDELVPLEIITKPGSSTLEKAYFPRRRTEFYTRRRVPLSQITPETFHAELATMKSLSHPHIVSVHASYTHLDTAYLLLTPTLEMTLKSFLLYPTPYYRALLRPAQKTTLLSWLAHLASALHFLHTHGLTHPDLRPSTITISNGTLLLTSISAASTLSPRSSTPLDETLETHVYAAPESRVLALHPHTTQTTSYSGRTRTETTTEHSLLLARWQSKSEDQKALVFTAAAIMLEILNLYANRKQAAFSAHRSAGNRRPRETAPPDASFGANGAAVGSWCEMLEERAQRKGDAGLGRAVEAVRAGLEKDAAKRCSLRGLYERVVEFDDGEEAGENLDGLGLLGGWEARGSVAGSTSSGAESVEDELGGWRGWGVRRKRSGLFGSI